jgi:hypothetical protein
MIWIVDFIKLEEFKMQLPAIGQTFYTSWGYDQTNYDFITVIGFTKSQKSAICQRCYTRVNEVKSSMVYSALQPIAESFGDKFKMKISEGYKGEITLRGSYPYCCDGKMENKRLDSFYPTKEGNVYMETNPQFGH